MLNAIIQALFGQRPLPPATSRVEIGTSERAICSFIMFSDSILSFSKTSHSVFVSKLVEYPAYNIAQCEKGTECGEVSWWEPFCGQRTDCVAANRWFSRANDA